MASKFSEKASAIRFDHLTAAGTAAQPGVTPPTHRPRTAMGTHVDALYRDKEIADENERLKEALQQHEGALPTRLLDPNDIVLSKFANRHPHSYQDKEFKDLREEIRAAGGNTQAIGVRPLPGQPGKYELSFGSRRRQACLEEALPVLATIEEMDDAGLFARMERENRHRKNLRPYEQGVLYLKALDEKVYPSAKKMATDLQIDLTSLGRLLAIARLPSAVLEAFASPLEIQYAWGPMLNDALQKNPDAVLAAAEQIKSLEERPSGKVVLATLVASCAAGSRDATPAKPIVIKGTGNQVAKVSFTKNGASVSLTGIEPKRRIELEALLRKFMT